MKKRLRLIILSVLFVMLITACGNIAGQQTDGTESKSSGQSENAQVINPLTETTQIAMAEATGLSLKAPADASDVTYFILDRDDDEKTAQINFNRNGKSYTFRAEITSEQNAYDMTGLYYDWSEEKEALVGSCPARLLLCDKAAGLYWLDNRVNYSLGCDSTISENEMLETASMAFELLQDSDGQTSGKTGIMAGTWFAIGSECPRYFFFDNDGVSGRALNVENGIGLGFAYEQQGSKYVFHWGSADNSLLCTVRELDETHISIEWEDQSSENLTYVSPLGSEKFHFYTNEELARMALAEYEARNNNPNSGLSVGIENNEDGSVTIQIYQNLSDHNSTAAWYRIDRTTGKGDDVNDPGVQIDLSEYAQPQ